MPPFSLEHLSSPIELHVAVCSSIFTFSLGEPKVNNMHPGDAWVDSCMRSRMQSALPGLPNRVTRLERTLGCNGLFPMVVTYLEATRTAMIFKNSLLRHDDWGIRADIQHARFHVSVSTPEFETRGQRLADLTPSVHEHRGDRALTASLEARCGESAVPCDYNSSQAV